MAYKKWYIDLWKKVEEIHNEELLVSYKLLDDAIKQKNGIRARQAIKCIEVEVQKIRDIIGY